MLIYADDILVTGNNNVMLPKLLRELDSLFAMKDLGPLHYFLSIEAHQASSNLYLTQTKCLLDLLHRTNMKDAKPLKLLVQLGMKLSRCDGDPIPNAREYRAVVGALQYVTLTRPDIAHAINQVRQFMHGQRSHHWMEVKRILCFLKAQSHLCCIFAMVHLHFLLTRMQTGLETQMIKAPHMVMGSLLVLT